MEIHLYISELAPGKNRLKHKIKNILLDCNVFRYQNPESFGKMSSGSFDEAIASVIMPESREELLRFDLTNHFWNSSKTILILPDNDQETFNLALNIRSVYLSGMNDNFSDVALILEHIKTRLDMKNKGKKALLPQSK